MKLGGRQYWKLYVRYLAGESTKREQAEVQARIAVDEEHGKSFDDLKLIWDAATRSHRRLDAQQAWKKLDGRVQQESKVKSLGVRPERPPLSSRRRLRPGVSRSLYVIGVLLLALVGTVLLARVIAQPEAATQRVQSEVFSTKKGQRATIQLTDGTLVHLNADSKFTVSAQFGVGNRGVELEGEAYFEVAPDSSRPFIVQTPHASVEVLGTAFDVSVYPLENEARVVVAEGRVSVRPAGAEQEQAVVLNPRELGVVSGGELPLVRRNVDLDQFLGWREGRLVFRNAPFKEVAAQLERKYGIEVELIGSPRTADGLTATFKDEPFGEVIKSIATTLNMDYTRSREKVSFLAIGSTM